MTSWAWGRRGHQIVGENAALVVSGEPEAKFMRSHSFDFAFYANVPDFIWKRPASNAMERPEHFTDLEIFKREFAKHPEIEKPFELSRKDLETKFPEIKTDAGRSFWRIRELNDQLEKVTKELRELKETSGPTRQKLQEKWVTIAGVMGHYVGDLGMPLHVSENYDGQMTGQKGIHSYFEDAMVDQLYPEINCEVNKEAMKQWPAFKKKNADKTVLQLIQGIGDRSTKAIPVLLTLDKKNKREETKKNALVYRNLIRDRLVDSTLALAEIYRRQLGWTFDDNKFYFFNNEPVYIQPGENPVVVPPPVDKPAK